MDGRYSKEKIIPDTNIYFDVACERKECSVELAHLIITGRIVAITCASILQEVHQQIPFIERRYEYFDSVMLRLLIGAISKVPEPRRLEERAYGLSDEHDLPFLALFISGIADYLVTRDSDLLDINPNLPVLLQGHIISPRDYLKHLQMPEAPIHIPPRKERDRQVRSYRNH